MGVKFNAVGCAAGTEQGGGGVQTNVSPLAGTTVGPHVTLAVLVAPAVVADQSVVVVRLLKSVLTDPLKPTWPVCAVPGCCDAAYTIVAVWLLAIPPPSLSRIWKLIIEFNPVEVVPVLYCDKPVN